jgi:hypothetical protein
LDLVAQNQYRETSILRVSRSRRLITHENDMMKGFSFCAGMAVTMLCACGGASDKPIETAAPAFNAAPAVVSDSNAGSAMPPSSGDTNTAAQSAKAPASGDALAVNPPHGQPGHTCDLPVGAPLNSKPAPAGSITTSATPIQVGAPQSGTPQVSVQPSVAPTVAAPTSSATPAAKPASGARINPPHGEPGHSCDVKVGDPLPG